MTEKPNPDLNLSNDVQVIRNILLGEYLDKFQNQVNALEKEVGDLKNENKALLKELETGNKKRFQELIARLEELEDNQGKLIAALTNVLLEYKNKSRK